MKIKEIYDLIDEAVPFSTAAEWDNTGLSVGSLDNEVSCILLALDVTSEVIEKAKEVGAQLVLTHHPLIFDGVKSIESDSVLYKAVQSGITFISVHTPLDIAKGGVNYSLAAMLGVENVHDVEEDEFLKLGEIAPMSADSFAENIKRALGGSVSYTDCGKPISKVALCGGAGGSCVYTAAQLGADALITGEAKHNQFLDSKELGVSLFSAGHYETEVHGMMLIQFILRNKFPDLQLEFSFPAPVKYM
ncbi:MAG: Nif3-like dinuclear metal center hexameric protein [Clostridia bacterium]|nr:Nif3-like dinuclear metal center hexameric protein [Clostridia bacterium]